jgi:hypothetical protein
VNEAHKRLSLLSFKVSLSLEMYWLDPQSAPYELAEGTKSKVKSKHLASLRLRT